jgi:hypothetical protein
MVPFMLPLCDTVSKLAVNCGASMKKKCKNYRDFANIHLEINCGENVKN